MSEREKAAELDYDEHDNSCYYCGGRGYMIVCCDDLCRSADECMHGDGEDNCPVCNRDGQREWEI